MFLSVSTHIFVYHELNPGFIDILADCGVDSIEIFASNPHFPYRNRKFVETFVNHCRRHKITIQSVHFPLYFHIDDIEKNRWLSLSSEDEELRLASIGETLAASQILDMVSGGILVVHPSIPGGEIGGKRTFLFLDSVNRLLDQLPETVRIAIENTTSASGTASATMGLAQSFPAERVGVCIDIGHANVVESPAFALVRTNRRLINVHSSDNLGKSDEHLPPGEGSINWSRIMRTLKGLHYRGPLTIEIRDPLKGKKMDLTLFHTIISKSMRFLHGLIDGE